MPTPTYDLIASNVLTSSASSVTFSSIPATYRDLVLVSEIITGTSSLLVFLRFNGDSGSNYNIVSMSGNGTDAGSGSSSNATRALLTFNQFASTTSANLAITQIMDYSATDKHKSVLTRQNSSAVTEALAQRWANTAAITSAEVSASTGTFSSGSTFYLYGIVS